MRTMHRPRRAVPRDRHTILLAFGSVDKSGRLEGWMFFVIYLVPPTSAPRYLSEARLVTVVLNRKRLVTVP